MPQNPRDVRDPGDSDRTLSTGGPGVAAAGQIGPYRLLQLIGEGGMGEVWLAEQKTPIHRTVALKLIKSGMDTKTVIARFESERQALALMDHPAIARVFDAGSTPEGRPYFVMEYVPGLPITEYCDKHRLTVRERLELFTQVCDGVQHAHQKAIIHRDLKPSNVLVVEHGGKAVPKIIDFGLAKATAQRLTERTLFTELGVLMGTPEYMSPEQADQGEQNIDTRTDVYSLGVILYQLLVGLLPFEAKALRAVGLEAILRVIREQEPAKPSTRIRSMDAASKLSAENRKEDPRTFARHIRGELDWITMKALEKDRTRRYGSPAELSADIQHHLANEPVIAHPPSAGYRASKFVRRHRFGVAAAASTVALLIAFAAAMAIQARRIAIERDRANRVTDFTQQIFKVSDPSEARGNSITARELLDKASKEIDSGLANDPEVQAQMLQVMGDVYRNLGLYTQAEPSLTRAIEIRRRVLGPNNPDTLTSMSSLAFLLYRQGREEEAEKLQRDVLETERRVLGPTDPRTVASMFQLSRIFFERGHYADAEKLGREALALEQQIHGTESHQAIMGESNLAFTLLEEGHYQESESLQRQALDKAQRVLGNDHPDSLRIMALLGQALHNEGRYSEAEKLDRQVVDVERRVLGPEHPQTLEHMMALSGNLERQNRNEEAEKLQRYVVQEESLILNPDSRVLLVAKERLADTLVAEKRYAEAETLLRQVVDSERRALGAEHSNTLDATNSLGNVLMEAGKYSEAEGLYRETLKIQQRVLRPDHPNIAITLYNLGCVTAHQGRKDEALSFLSQAVNHGLPAPGDLGMGKDPDLNSLQADTRFIALVAHAKEVAKEQQKAASAAGTGQKTN